MQEIRLPIGKAEALATAVRSVRIVPPAATVMCPQDLGAVTTIVFETGASQTAPATPMEVRWATTGCASIDNGRILTSQIANPSFWRFEEVFRSLVDGTPRPAAG